MRFTACVNAPMKLKTKATQLLVLVLLAFAGAQAGEVKLAVAADVSDAARALAEKFGQVSGHVVNASYGSPGKLLADLAGGDAYEVLLVSDRERPAKVEADGLAVPGTRFTFARDRLVLWSAKPQAFADGEVLLRSGDFRRLAIANPKTTPYGVAAQQVLEQLGAWEQAQARLARGDTIAQAFQFVATANAEAGLVAFSQVKAWTGEPGTLWEIPDLYYTPIDQQAVLLKAGEGNPAAREFLAFLKGPEARVIIAGFYGTGE